MAFVSIFNDVLGPVGSYLEGYVWGWPEKVPLLAVVLLGAIVLAGNDANTWNVAAAPLRARAVHVQPLAVHVAQRPAVGAFLALSPLAATASIVVSCAIVAATTYVSVGSLGMAVTLPAL